MDFIRASKQEDGTKFKLREYDMFDNDYLYFEDGTVYNKLGTAQHATINLITATWEIVEDKIIPLSSRRFLRRTLCSNCDDSFITQIAHYDYNEEDVQESVNKLVSRVKQEEEESAINDRQRDLIFSIIKELFGDLVEYK